MSAAAAPLPRYPDCSSEPDRAETGANWPGLPVSDAQPQRRPRLLLDAARHGLGDYRSSRDLPRLIGPDGTGPAILARLIVLEAALETARLAGSPSWSCLRHVEVLIALLAERRLLQ